MAIVVLVLWLFTTGAGFSLLLSSNLSRARPAAPAPAEEPATASVAFSAQAASTPAQGASTSAQAVSTATQAASTATQAASTATQAVSTATQAASTATQAAFTQAAPAAKRQSRASRDRFAPPSLVAARNAPVLPGLRSVLEFAHPACAIIGLGFWLGYTFVHYRPMGWIAFGLVTVTVCLGLSWFAANTRAARRQLQHDRQDDPRPSFSTRLMVLHGGAAAVTFTLAALTALVLGR